VSESFYNTPARQGFRFPGQIYAEPGIAAAYLAAQDRRTLFVVADRWVEQNGTVRLPGGPDAAIWREPHDTDIPALLQAATGRTIETILSLRHGSYTTRDRPRGFARPRLVAIPTSCGSGSETSRHLVLTDQATGLKTGYRSWDAVPDLTLLDPRFLADAPPAFLASGAFDACIHLWETHAARGERSAFTDAIARDFLPRILAQLHGLARGQRPGTAGLLDLMQASAMAGVAISNVRTGLIHTLGEGLSAQMELPHPLTLRVFLQAAVESYASQIADRLAPLWASANAHAALRAPWCTRVFLAAWEEVFTRLGLDAAIAAAFAAALPSLDRLCADAARDTVLAKENPVPLDTEGLRLIAQRGLSRFQSLAGAPRAAVNAR
jgi:alcohol dehydrogenase class IV